jgi:Arc/MetJ family transcription regulator
MHIMRTNIVIDDELMEEAKVVTGLKTKREVVEQALRTLIQVRRQRHILDLKGKIHWEGDLEEMRQGRGVGTG